MSHSLQTSTLRFGYEALEPSIDAETMELHHDKHHHAYVESLNAALAPYPHLADLDIDDLRGRLAGCPSKSARLCATMAAVTPITRCSGRSWLRTRAARRRGRSPTRSPRDFGSFARFQTLFADAATKNFGSGWTFLVV